MHRSISILLAGALSASLLSSCTTANADYEQQAKDRLAATTREYRPADKTPDLPILTVRSTPEDYLRFALLNHPQVESAYDAWRASVSSVGPARSLPDPKLTFQADIGKTLMSVMPGLMFDIMNTGRRTAMGQEAAAGSEVARRRFNAAAQEVARNLRHAWIELAYVEAAGQLHLTAAGNVEGTLALADTSYITGRSMGGLGAQLALQSEAAEHHTHHAILKARRHAARAAFKSALGLKPADNDPPWPDFALTDEPLPDAEVLWARILERNPGLVTLRAQVEQSIAAVKVAEAAGTPSFSLGAMVDVKANPLMFRPTASLSLPIWRTRIADQIAAATARRDAATAMIDATELDLAARLARALYAVQRADRVLAYLDNTALPNLDRSITAAAADYESGRSEAMAVTKASTKRVLLRIERLDMLRERADAITDLLFLSADLAPAGAAIAQN